MPDRGAPDLVDIVKREGKPMPACDLVRRCATDGYDPQATQVALQIALETGMLRLASDLSLEPRLA